MKAPKIVMTYVKMPAGKVLSVDVVKRKKPLKVKRLIVPITETGLGFFADNPREVISKPGASKLRTKPYYGLDYTTSEKTISDFKRRVKGAIVYLETGKK